MDRQKVERIILRCDQREFLAEQLAQFFGQTLAVIARPCRAHRHPDQPAHRRPSRRHGLVRIFITQIVEFERDPREHVLRCRNRVRRIGKQPRHFGCRFQVTLAIGGKAAARAMQRRLFANAGHDILQRTVFGRGVKRGVECDEGNTSSSGECLEHRKSSLVATRAVHCCANPDAAGKTSAKRHNCPFSASPRLRINRDGFTRRRG